MYSNHQSDHKAHQPRASYNSSYINDYYSRGVETQLLPNEIRVGSRGNFKFLFETAMDKIQSGYEHVKLVARGEAVPIAEELLSKLKLKATKSQFSVNYTQSLNKRGKICDEVHIMVTQKQFRDSESSHFTARTQNHYEGMTKSRPPMGNYYQQDDRQPRTQRYSDQKPRVDYEGKRPQRQHTPLEKREFGEGKPSYYQKSFREGNESKSGAYRKDGPPMQRDGYREQRPRFGESQKYDKPYQERPLKPYYNNQMGQRKYNSDEGTGKRRYNDDQSDRRRTYQPHHPVQREQPLAQKEVDSEHAQ